MVAMTNRTLSAATNQTCMEVVNGRVKDAAERTMAMAMGNVAANMRPKELEDAAALSMVAMVVDQAMTNSGNAMKGEEQSTSDVRR